jgi:hypothetical protein
MFRTKQQRNKAESAVSDFFLQNSNQTHTHPPTNMAFTFLRNPLYQCKKPQNNFRVSFCILYLRNFQMKFANNKEVMWAHGSSTTHAEVIVCAL